MLETVKDSQVMNYRLGGTRQGHGTGVKKVGFARRAIRTRTQDGMRKVGLGSLCASSLFRKSFGMGSKSDMFHFDANVVVDTTSLDSTSSQIRFEKGPDFGTGRQCGRSKRKRTRKWKTRRTRSKRKSTKGTRTKVWERKRKGKRTRKRNRKRERNREKKRKRKIPASKKDWSSEQDENEDEANGRGRGSVKRKGEEEEEIE